MPDKISMKSAAFGLSLVSFLILASCNGDVTGADLEGTANVTVLDANTGLPVQGAWIRVVGGAEKKTSANGQASLDNLRAGAYLVILEKKGYEVSQEPLTIATSGTQEVVALTASPIYRIHRKGVSIKGRVLLRPVNNPDTTAVISLAGIRVELRSTATGTGSDNTVYPFSVQSATTTATGHFTFDSLPEISSYAVLVPEFLNGGKYFSLASTGVASGTLLAGQSYTHPNITLNPAAAGTLQVFARSSRLDSAQAWVFEFSSSIDTSKFTTTAIQLRRAIGTGTPANIASRRTWNPGFTVLSVRPDSTGTGTWIAGSTYSVVLTGVRDLQNRVLATTTLTSLPVPAP